MEEDHYELNYVQSKLIFGKLTDTPNIDYVPVKDINNKTLYIPCQNLQIPIQKVIQNYKLNSNCAKGIQPCLVIEQGNKRGQVAISNQILSGFNFNWKQICFIVADSQELENNNRRFSDKKERQREQVKPSNQLAQLKIIVNGVANKFNLSIELSSRIIDLKKKVIAEIPNLKKMTPDLLTIGYKGLIITNQAEPLSKYKIQSGQTILIKIKIKQGCFSKDSLITMANHTTVNIQKIKINDQIISYNLKTGIYQTDTVTFVQKSYVQQSLNIVLQNNIAVKTTPNHLFLCQDGQFRCYSADIKQENQKQTLKIGTSLQSFNGQPVKILQMLSSRVQNDNRQFYHLSISKNHNFIVNGLITHNMFLNLKYSNGSVERIDTQPSECIKQLKQRIQMLTFIQVHHQSLNAYGKELQNQKAISDYNIAKQTTLHFNIKKNDSFNLVRQGTKILTSSKQHVPVENLNNGDQIAAFDTVTGKLAEGGKVIQLIEKVATNEYMDVGLGQYDNSIFMAADSYLQLTNGEAIHIRDICYQRGDGEILRKYNGQTVKVKGMAHNTNYSKKYQNFYKISLIDSKTFIANQIIFHDQVINIILIKNQKKFRRICFGVKPQDQIGLIKDKIQAVTNISASNIILSFNQEQLVQYKTIGSYQINSQHIVIGNVLSPVSKFGKSTIFAQAPPQRRQEQQKIIYIQISQTQKSVLNYQQNKDKTVEQIISDILPNYNSSYFFIFADIILYPTDPLRKLEQLNQNFRKYSQNTVILVKNQKLAFLQKMKINKEDIGNYSMLIHRSNSNSAIQTSNISAISRISANSHFQSSTLVQRAGQRIKKDSSIILQKFKQQPFYMPFLQLTSRQFTQKISKYIISFQRYKKQYQSNEQIFNIIKDLYINMQLLPNYLEKCYLGLTNFRFSKYFKKQNTFYLHSFTIAFKSSSKDKPAEKVEKALKGQSGTLFHITSLNGKSIQHFSMFPNEGEILFAPFTHFMVVQIIEGKDYDEVYLVELSSPITFQKDIILWVDDEPNNNTKQINKILRTQDIQILQATSTNEAVKWIKQFGWLVNWKGLNFKIVSDNKRFQGIIRPGYQRKTNFTAGIDLLKLLYNEYGFTVSTLLYCGNEEKARAAAQQANIVQNKHYKITQSMIKLYQFFGIKQN